MKQPELGEKIRLFPAPRTDVEHVEGKPPALRRVQDGSGNFGRFLSDEGAERAFDYYWHDRLVAGDVCVTDPRTSYRRAAHETAARETAPTAAPASPEK